MSFEKWKSENCLFLVCPTDKIEPLLIKRFKGQAFFYTALGACFGWDIATQKSIVELIHKQHIRQIKVVTKMSNNFFKDKVQTKYNLAHYPVEKDLQLIEDNIPKQLQYWNRTITKLDVLAATYLEHQKRRLLDTSLLGKTVAKKKIGFTGLLYDKKSDTFYESKKLKQRVEFLETISIN